VSVSRSRYNYSLLRPSLKLGATPVHSPLASRALVARVQSYIGRVKLYRLFGSLELLAIKPRLLEDIWHDLNMSIVLAQASEKLNLLFGPVAKRTIIGFKYIHRCLCINSFVIKL